MKEIPKEKFPKVYEIIDAFKKDYHSPFVNNFSYILLNLVKCPKCYHLLNVEIKDNYGVSSYISLNGVIVDKISSLLERYMSKKFGPYSTFNCRNCNYKGPGKDKLVFLNSPRFLLFSFEDEIQQKTLDDYIYLSDYIFPRPQKIKYNLLSFITEENNKYKAYIKNDRGMWCEYNEENIMGENVLINNYSIIPYIVIYEKEI